MAHQHDVPRLKLAERRGEDFGEEAVGDKF